MKIGLALWPDRDLRDLVLLARAAEAAGFAELWWPDHYDARECSALLSLCAMNTSRIGLGTAVTSPALRHPALIAAWFATLSELSDGRAIAGLGPGGFEVKTELQAMPRHPVAASREAVQIVRALLRGDSCTMPDGQVFPVVGARLGFQAEQHVPIFLAARGPRMLELAGEVADGVITHGLAGPYFALVAERVKAGATLAGRPTETCEISVMVEVALGKREEALDALRPRCRFMVGGNYDEALIPLYGLDPAPVMRLRAAVRARDPDAIRLIDEAMIDAFCFAGPERIVEGLGALASMGVDSVILSPGTSVGDVGIGELGRIVHEVKA